MLVDDAIQSFSMLQRQVEGRASPATIAMVNEYLDSLKQAAAYALDADTAVFLESLSPDVALSAVSIRDVRWPHDTMFIEFPFPGVSEERARNGSPVVEGEVVPRKIGALLRRRGDEVWGSLLAPGDHTPTNTPFVELRISDLGKEGVLHSDVRKLFAPPTFTDDQMEGVLQDFLSELPLILTFILFLNSPDPETITSEDIVPAPKLNSSRVRSGKEPLKAYRRIKLGQFGHMHLDAVVDEDRARRAGVRAHFVRGHYMRSHAKIVWRRPHVRGGKDDGSTPEPVRAQVQL